MMSFTEMVKGELTRIRRDSIDTRRAELLALLRMNGSMIMGGAGRCGMEFSTRNNAAARRVLVYLKKDFGLKPVVMVRQGRKLRRKNVYTLTVRPSEEGFGFLTRLGFLPLSPMSDMEVCSRAEDRRAYLAGAFLGGGSVNRPQRDYHLEMVTQSYPFASLIMQAMHFFHMTPKMTDRKNNYIVYVKDGEEVTAFLRVVGADRSLLEFENVRVMKDMRNQVNRQVNCETANLQKSVDAAIRQKYQIKLILSVRAMQDLPEKIQETCRLRMENPNAAISELADMCGISKSGLAHRFQKIARMAASIERERAAGGK